MGHGACGGASDGARRLIRTADGAFGERPEQGIALGSCGCCACVAVVDPRGLGEALEAGNRGRIVAFDRGVARASIVQGFDELGLGLDVLPRLAREVAAGWQRVGIIDVILAVTPRACEDAIGDRLGYKGIEPAHTFTVSRHSGSASVSCGSDVPGRPPTPAFAANTSTGPASTVT